MATIWHDIVTIHIAAKSLNSRKNYFLTKNELDDPRVISNTGNTGIRPDKTGLFSLFSMLLLQML